MKYALFTALTFSLGIAGYFTYLLVWTRLSGYDRVTVYFDVYHEHLFEAVLLSFITVASVIALVCLFFQWFPKIKE